MTSPVSTLRGLAQLGAKQAGIAFEKDKDGYIFHVVEGKRKLAEYSYESGSEIKEEIYAALGKTINFEQEHVLAIHGLCRRDDDDRYIFNAPYYGGGTQRGGFCHAADCELLDPKLLSVTTRKIHYTEHYYPRVVQTLATFNTWYLGGIAHELGHGIGLPHDSGSPAERAEITGFTLMGSGNHHYREDRSGGLRPAYLSLASGLRLLSNPLVTGSNRGRFEDNLTRLEKLKFSQVGKKLTVEGTIGSRIPAYAVVMYLWRPPTWPGNPQQDHGSISHPVSLSENGFSIESIGHESR